MNELLDKLKKGDEQAFREVMSMYKNQIFNYLALMTGNKQIAEELTQDTFVKVYFKAKTLRTENLKAWMYRIATNLAISELRKKKMKKIFSLEDVNDLNYSSEENPGKNIEIEETLNLIPEKYRIPLIMKEIDNFSFEEMSAILKKPVGTLKSLVFRGKEKVKKELNVQLGGNNG